MCKHLFYTVVGGQHDGLFLSGSPPILYIYVHMYIFLMANKLCCCLLLAETMTQPGLHNRRRFWHATHDCIAPYVDTIVHRGRLGWCFRSCWMVLSHVMWRRPSCLLQSAGGEANRILLASALSFMRIICPNKLSRHNARQQYLFSRWQDDKPAGKSHW